jgi:hypothetical protein
MESIFDDLNQHRIAPQRFGLAIAICIVCIVLSNSYFFLDKNWNHIFYLANVLVSIYLLVQFRRYLGNFMAARPVFLLKLKIIASWIMFGLLLLNLLYRIPEQKDVILPWYWLRILLFVVLYYVIILFDLVVSVLNGIALQKIPNDFVGITKTLGIVNAYIIPLPYLIANMISLLPKLNHIYNADENLPVRLVVHTFFLIPTFLLMLIFFRARRFQFRNEI